MLCPTKPRALEREKGRSARGFETMFIAPPMSSSYPALTVVPPMMEPQRWENSIDQDRRVRVSAHQYTIGHPLRYFNLAVSTSAQLLGVANSPSSLTTTESRSTHFRTPLSRRRTSGHPVTRPPATIRNQDQQPRYGGKPPPIELVRDASPCPCMSLLSSRHSECFH